LGCLVDVINVKCKSNYSVQNYEKELCCVEKEFIEEELNDDHDKDDVVCLMHCHCRHCHRPHPGVKTDG